MFGEKFIENLNVYQTNTHSLFSAKAYFRISKKFVACWRNP